MRRLVSSYLEFAKGRKTFSFWFFLAPLELITRMVVSFRNLCYDHGISTSIEPSIPVISVGNLTLGGTNKTPFVEMLILELAGRGIRTGIITRGYGGRVSEPVVIRNGMSTRELVGDEPLLLSSRLENIPVAVSRDRLKDVEALKGEGVELVVADDCFQHRKLGRDVDIVLIDATCPFGNGLFTPAGILREPHRSLSRSHMVVITKTDQVSEDRIAAIRGKVSEYLKEDHIFSSRLELSTWSFWQDGWEQVPEQEILKKQWIVFSAIGNPESLRIFLEKRNIKALAYHFFKDHHRFSLREMELLHAEVKAGDAAGLLCTEKDIHNLPEELKGRFRIVVPRVRAVVEEKERFFATLVSCLRPRVMVTSNGFGEDAIGSILAERLITRFEGMSVRAFPVVGRGMDYRKRGIPVIENPFVSPTGGVIKYRFRDLFLEIRAGLLKNISRQLKIWKCFRGRVRTVICVGDVYLLLQTLWGQGQLPVLVATAKTVRLSGHWKLERFLLKHRCRRVWTRDEETATEMLSNNVDAVYSGNPIMDLLCDNKEGDHPWTGNGEKTRILLLPGSRERAYRDMSLILQAALLLKDMIRAEFTAVMAPSISIGKMIRENPGWSFVEDHLQKGEFRIRVLKGNLVGAARNADIVLGFGGTANQLCAGMGKPVVSIMEKGKNVQKKLLGDSESLVPGTPGSLASEILRIISSEEEYRKMSRAGLERLGAPGAISSLLEYLSDTAGWECRARIYSELAEDMGKTV